MTVDYLIVGQGICGTMLSYYLHKEGKTYMVIDDSKPNASSRVAAGVINPVTGRRYVYTWMIDELMSFAKQSYNELEDYFQTPLIYQKSIIDFFPSPQMRDAFVNRVLEDDTYLHTYPDQNKFNQYFNYDFGCGEIGPCYMVDLQHLLSMWRSKLIEQSSFVQESFNPEDLGLKNDHIRYNDITASKIIFCDGISSMKNPWFELLPFSANKGEALII
ncbi:MAG TPA: FAD-dependent oxidoreductase, partial [Chitinophagaceae bacterium]